MKINFQPVSDFLDGVSQQFGVPACECIICQDHQILYRHHAGTLDWAKKIPLQGGEWYWIYSCTKLMTVTATMQLAERGLLSLDDPVSKFLPEFADVTVREGDTVRPAKTTLTIRHLLTMTGGFNYDQTCPSILRAKEESHLLASTREMITALSHEPLDFDPGTHFCYSLCHDVLGAVLEVASGERFSDYLQRHIAGPLGITGITFRPTEEQLAHMPDQICWHDQRREMFLCEKGNSHQLTRNYDSGGAGICCRVEDYIPFLDALACGGVGANGARILTEKSIRLIDQNHLSGQTLEDFHNTMKPNTEGYGLGMRVRITDDGLVPVGEFGWDGAAGALAVMEPKSRLSVFYVQHVLNYLPNYAQLHPALMARVYRALRGE